MYKITIFTSTFNRKSHLSRLYQCLSRQDYKNFEWIIIDDGSTDETAQIVKEWIAHNLIHIRYYFQENQGKHIAFNSAIKLANSVFFICIDSDDYYIDGAFSRLVEIYGQINNKENYSGMAFLAKNSGGEIIGDYFPDGINDIDLITMYYKHNVSGDKGLMFVTSVLKNYQFPVFPDEKFSTESILYSQLSKHYKTRFINEAFVVVEYQIDGLSSKYRKLIEENPKGAYLNYRNLISFELRGIKKYKTYIQYIRFSLVNNYSINSLFKNAPSLGITLLCLPCGILLHYYKKFIKKSGNSK